LHEFLFHEAKILFAPGKASNAGGVAVSGLEMAQNSQRIEWTRKEVNAVTMHAYFSDVGEKYMLLFRHEFPTLQEKNDVHY